MHVWLYLKTGIHMSTYIERKIFELHGATGLCESRWPEKKMSAALRYYNVVLNLIHFTSAYWHITRLCHHRSLMGAGDSLVCSGSRSHLTNTVAQPSITLIHFQCGSLLWHSSHDSLCNNSDYSIGGTTVAI